MSWSKAEKEAWIAQNQQTVEASKAAIRKFSSDILHQLEGGEDELLKQFAADCANFRPYSPGNQELIRAACRSMGITKSHVASKKAWKKIGIKLHGKPYYVKADAVPIMILVPWFHKPKEEKGKRAKTNKYERYSQVPRQEEEWEVVTRFNAGPVYDGNQIRQGVDPEWIDKKTGQPLVHPPLPNFFHNLPEMEEARKYYDALSQIAMREGVLVLEREDFSTYEMAASATATTLSIRPSSDSRSKFSNLVHEYTHWSLGHTALKRGEKSDPTQEGQAELTAWIVALHFGIETPFSKGYLQNYGQTPKTIMRWLDFIQSHSATIIVKIEQELGNPLYTDDDINVDDIDEAA